MFWPWTAAGTSASLCPTSLDMLWLVWAGRRKLFTLIIRNERWPMLTTHKNCRQKLITLIMSWILGRTQAQTVQVLFTIYIHVEGNPGFHRSRKRKVQEKWRFSHTHTPRFYTANHSCPKQQVGHRSREKCLAQSSSDERICVLALNGKHNSSVMGDRCVKPTLSSAQSEWRGKERAKQ